MNRSIVILISYMMILSCTPSAKENKDDSSVRLITLDPGHFHAALVQKSMYALVDTNVYVYAPEGEDVAEHMKRIDGYNKREENPTRWNSIVYKGPDFLQKMLSEKKGNVVVLAGNNQKKTEYIRDCIDAGFHVLADKPMSISMEDFRLLEQAFESAGKKGLLLYDMMTERSEITTILQKEFSRNREVFGELEYGTPENPAITKESVHHFFKYVSGVPLRRPAWFFDVQQEGEGIVDVTTHLVDLIQWECFPDQIIDYQKDVAVLHARHWTTGISPAEFKIVTGLDVYPDYLKKDLADTLLNVFANGEINYRIRNVHAKVSVIWNFKAPEGGSDTHFSVMRGTRASLIIRQGKEQQFRPTLYIEPAARIDQKEYETALHEALKYIQTRYPGTGLKKTAAGWEVIIPDSYKIGHEAHFAEVTERFLRYLQEGSMPDWEVPNMLAKYYITAKALEMARQNQ